MNLDAANLLDECEVAIIGAGILGLLNALQLAKRGLRVVLIDNTYQRRSYKVGESLLTYTNSFLRTIGELDDFLNTSFPKEGIWFCHGLEHATTFDNASEWAFQSRVPDRWDNAVANKKFFRTMFKDVQVVRPEAEDCMRAAVRSHPNILFIDDSLVKDVVLKGEDEPHEILWQSKIGPQTGTVRSKWVLDCSGRRRFLAKELQHTVDFDDDFQTTAVWAQFKDVGDHLFDQRWVYHYPEGGSTRRDHNTCHFWGAGYWIWVIRLSDNRISIGATFDQSNPPPGANYREQFWNLINRYPLLHGKLSEDNMLEMRTYRNVQYIIDTHVSCRRYGIVGDAASIIDAYYSQGMSLGMATSWHIANIMYADLREGKLDEMYIRRVNRATLQDWRMMRAMIKAKYSRATADSRYFLLSHVLDYIVFAAALVGRFRLSRWLAETGGYPDRETRLHKRMRDYLAKRLFLSQSFPWDWIAPETVQKIISQLLAGMERRGLWRLEKGVHLENIKCITRPTSPIPALWRLPFLRRNRPADLSGREITEPRSLRISGKEVQPFVLTASGPSLLLIFAAAYLFDWMDTAMRKLLIGKAASHSKGRE